MNRKIYNETLQACLAGGMTDDAAHEYATDKATRNETKAKAPKTAGELKAAGFVMTGSTTDETARKEIERDYAASGFDVEWTQLVNGTWNYYTRKHERTASHTPGPWSLAQIVNHETNPRFADYRQDILGPQDSTRGNSSIVIATIINRDSPYGEANAKLIAQAPAMLKTLQSCFEMLNSPKFSSWIEANCADDELWAMTAAMVQRREEICEVIAKATEAEI